MQKINLHLAYLLTRHECVIIPGFGALVVHSTRSSLRRLEEEVFVAPSRTLGFNPELRHNDGLLANSLMKAQGISYEGANLYLHQFAAELTACLNTNREVVIPSVGRFTLTSENKMAFSPKTSPSCNGLNYGLSDFYFPSLNLTQCADLEVEKRNNTDIIWIPLNKKIIHSIGSIAAVVLAFVLFSTPIENQQIPVQYASVLSSQLSTKSEEHTVELSPEKNQLSVTHDSFDSVHPEASIKDLENNKLDTTSMVDIPSKYYCIVVASLPTKKIADKALSAMQSSCFNQAEILGCTSPFRICINKFSEKQVAETYLNGFRTSHPEYKDAWLLVQRSKSQK